MKWTLRRDTEDSGDRKVQEVKTGGNMERKALFFDIDGTLLSEVTGEVPDSAVHALQQAMDNGHLTFINTGRTWCALPEMFRRMPFSGYLCGCGTYIQYGDEVLLKRSIPMERADAMVRMLRENHADMILEGTEDCFVPERRTRFDRLEGTRRYFRGMGLAMERYTEQSGLEYDKFVFYTDEQSNCPAIFEDLSRDMDIMDRRGGFYEVVPKGFSKATAIDYILKYFDLKKEDAYVFGDSSNDLSMFEAVPHAVAMGAHDPVLDPYTEFVTKTVEEDGLEYAMQHYGLI